MRLNPLGLYALAALALVALAVGAAAKLRRTDRPPEAALRKTGKKNVPPRTAPSIEKPRREPVLGPASGRRTTADVVDRLKPELRPALSASFARQNLAYPPARLTLVALKAERSLEVWAPDGSGRLRLVRTYPVLAASGGPGPKLREGDRQVPEGVYAVETLNPNSKYHLSIKLDYPNAFDRAMARREGRANLGGDIFVHGGAASIGCLALGDAAIEELFLLVAETGRENVRAVVAPRDFRKDAAAANRISDGAPAWTAELYRNIRTELTRCTSP
jgi:hypothetical protein